MKISEREKRQIACEERGFNTCEDKHSSKVRTRIKCVKVKGGKTRCFLQKVKPTKANKRADTAHAACVKRVVKRCAKR